MARFPAHICERFIAGSDRRALGWRLLLITLVGVAAYCNTFTSAFNFDDNSNIFGGNAIRNMGSLRELFDLRPMRSVGNISFALNFRLFGQSPLSFHLTNLLIHLLSASLTAALVLVTWRTPALADTTPVPAEQSGRTARLAALLAGLLFVAHPIQTQAVTYLVQRYAALATLFYLATVVCYARARLAMAARCWSSGLGWGAVALATTILAMKSKEIAFTLPLTLVLYEFCFFRGRLRWRLVAVAGFLLTMAVIPVSIYGTGFFRNLGSVWESLRVQTVMSRTDYLFSQLPVIAKYLRLIVYPAGQSIEHMAVQYKSFWAGPVLGSAGLLGVLLLAGCGLLWRGRRGAAGLLLIGFGICWFFLTLTVESSIIPIVDLIFEHRVYLPFAGVAMAVAVGITLVAERCPRPGWVYAAAGVVVLALAGITHARNEVWRTPVTLWQDATVKAPLSARAWNNLAYAYLRAKRPAEALVPLLRSIELNPGPPDVWNNIGIALDQLGEFKGRSRRNYNMFRSSADLLKGQSEWFANAYNNLGLAHEYLRQPAAAIQAYETAFKYVPDYPLARLNLGISALMLGNRSLAEEQYAQLLRLEPTLAAELGRLLGH